VDHFQVMFPHILMGGKTRNLPDHCIFCTIPDALSKTEKTHIIKILMWPHIYLRGLTLFLTGVNVGFMPVGSYLGSQLAMLDNNWILVPIAMLIAILLSRRSRPLSSQQAVADLTEALFPSGS
jgi:hypothetical protein